MALPQGRRRARASTASSAPPANGSAAPGKNASTNSSAQIRSLFPDAREAKLERGVIVVEKRATFSPLPGVDRLRPGQAPPPGGIANLYLAGDYTRTGWPATMEGAVRSGYLAADAVAQRVMNKTNSSFIVEDLPVQWPARLLGL